ncbi:MAG TPA: prepilin-type N-terminal cleavage/methylation domain-containing protein [Gaiellaceae bacterium]
MLSRHTPGAGSEAGFSLVELLIAMGLMSLLFGSFAALGSLMTSRDATMTRQAYLSTQGRAAIDTLSGALESAMCNGTTQPITSATPTQVQFFSPDRLQPFHLMQITYSLSGGVFSRQVAASTNTNGPPWTMGAAGGAFPVVASVVNTAVFKYYDSSGTDLSPAGAALTSVQLPKVARVTATLTLTPLASRGVGSLTTQGSATVRTWTTQQACVQ